MTSPHLQTEIDYSGSLSRVKWAEVKENRLFISSHESVLLELVRSLTDSAGQPTPCLSRID